MRDITLGMVGVSPGNGHPYSFSSIINGYSDSGLANADWDVIYDYVREKDPSEIGFDGVEITHAWTQDESETRRLCEAALIPNQVSNLEDLIGEVDGVIIARDDYERHLEMALPFLEADMPVFLDKPLAVDVDELNEFRPYLENGQLMSCSGMRYARELDTPRGNLDEYGELKLVRGTVINDWEKYGAHMLDAIFNVIDADPISVNAYPADHSSMAIEMNDGSIVQIDTLGDAPLTFHVEFYGSDRVTRHDLRDNFRAFRRTLWHFIQSIETGDPAIPAATTLELMRILLAGRISKREERSVDLNEIGI